MTDLQWHNETRRVNELVPYEKNPRKLTAEQQTKLVESIQRFNLVEVPAIDTDNRLIAGHQRMKIMQLLGRGEEEIDVRVPNRKLTQEEFDEYLIRSNKNTGEWDIDLLRGFGKDLLQLVGFSNEEIIPMFGLFSADSEDVDPERHMLIEVQPPGSPRLKDRAYIQCVSYEDYAKMKLAIMSGMVGVQDIMEIIESKKI